MGPDALQRLGFRGITAFQVERVHRLGDDDVRIRVEARDELLSLIIEIPRYVVAAINRTKGVFAIAVRLTRITLIKQLGRLVRDHPDRAGQPQSTPRLLGWRIQTVMEIRIEPDYLSLQM